MDKLSNLAKHQKLRLFLLVHCLSPPWNVPQHQILLFPKMIMPLHCHRWVKSTAATTSASTNPSATTSVDHLSQRWQNHSGTLCLQTSSQEQWMIFCFVRFLTTTLTITTTIYNNNKNKFTTTSPPHSRSPPPSTTTRRTSSQVCTTIHRQECRQVPKEHCTTVQVNIDIKIAGTLPSHIWFDNPTVVTGEKVRHHVQTRVPPSQPWGMPSRSFFLTSNFCFVNINSQNIKMK